MEKPPKHHVFFAVFGFGDDPEVVTCAMGVEPTKAWIKGEPTGKGRGIQTHNRWVLQSTLPLAEPIERTLRTCCLSSKPAVKLSLMYAPASKLAWRWRHIGTRSIQASVSAH